MKNKKRRFIALSLSFVLAITIINDKVKGKTSNIYIDEEIDNPYYIGSCLKGNVYLASKEEIKILEESGLEGIFIIDERNDKEPNIQIIDSYSINNTNDMKDILTIVKNYDEENPSKWSRTITSMINEWWIHNICFIYDYNKGKTRDVDLNNSDEDVFKTFDLQRLVLRKKELER